MGVMVFRKIMDYTRTAVACYATVTIFLPERATTVLFLTINASTQCTPEYAVCSQRILPVSEG